MANNKFVLPTLIVIRLLGTTAFYALVPFLAVWLTRVTLLSSAEVGVVVGVCIFSTRAGGLALVWPVRKLGARGSIIAFYVTGALALAFLVVGRQAGPALLCGVVGVVGVAFSGATLAVKTLAASTQDGRTRLRSFSWLNIATNVGAAFGPLLGSALAQEEPLALPTLVGAILVAASALALAVRFDSSHSMSGTDAGHAGPSEGTAPFVRFVLLASATWFGYSQIFNVLPVAALGTQMAPLVPVVFAVNGVLIILLQMPITSFVSRRTGDDPALRNRTLAIGNALMALGLGSFWWGAEGAWIWVAAAVIFTVGETLWSPLYDEMAVHLRAGLSVPAALGWSSFLWGIAESVGAAVGTSIVLNQSTTLSPFAIAALTSAAASLLFFGEAARRRAIRDDRGPQPSMAA